MISPLEIEFRNAQPTEVVESRIRQEFAELEKFYSRLVSCRVEVEVPEHERRGGLCNVLVDLGLPPADATALAELQSLSGKRNTEHMEIRTKRRDAAMAVHAAFNVARRRLKDLGGTSLSHA